MNRFLGILFLMVCFASCNVTPAQVIDQDISDWDIGVVGDGILLDVRTPEEFERGHLPGAQNINFLSKDFEVLFEGLDKKKKLYVYCQVGGRSTKASQKLSDLGFTDIVNLIGGFSTWQREGNIVEK